MGGGGSIANMLTTVRMNSALLRKRRFFKRKRSFFDLETPSRSLPNFHPNTAPISEREKARVRKKMQQEKRWRNAIIIATISTAMVFLIAVAWKISTKTYKGILTSTKTNNPVYQFERKKARFYFYLEDGDHWLRQRKYYNACFQYRKALLLFPKNQEVKLRLAAAQTYHCRAGNQYCADAIGLLDELQKKDSENPVLYRLSHHINLAHGDTTQAKTDLEIRALLMLKVDISSIDVS